MTISAAVSILEKNEPCRADRPGALCRWIAFTHCRVLFMYADHISKHHTPSSLPSMRPYGIVKAIRTSSPPRRVSIGAAAVAANEPLPSPLTLDVLFVCLPSCVISHKHKKKCCCTKFSLRTAAPLSHQQFHIVLVQKSLTMQCFCVSTGCLTPPR